MSASAAQGISTRLFFDTFVMQLTMYPDNPSKCPSTTFISSTSCFIIISRMIWNIELIVLPYKGYSLVKASNESAVSLILKPMIGSHSSEDFEFIARVFLEL